MELGIDTGFPDLTYYIIKNIQFSTKNYRMCKETGKYDT